MHTFGRFARVRAIERERERRRKQVQNEDGGKIYTQKLPPMHDRKAGRRTESTHKIMFDSTTCFAAT